jgi:hypothetical protein
MSEQSGKQPDQSQAPTHHDQASRRPYRTPTLQDFGSVSNLTQAFVKLGGADGGIYT